MAILDYAGAAQRGFDPAVALAQLRAVAGQGQVWLESLPPQDSRRASVIEMRGFAEEYAARGDVSPDVMTTVRAILCVNCRLVNAAHGKCFGAGLDKCMLLKGLRT